MTNEEKTQAMLGSPAGCALLLDVSANLHLPLERFAEPRVSFWLAAMAVDFVDVNRDAGWQKIALREARAFEDLARQVVSHPAFDWWWDPVDLACQVWASPQMPRGPDGDPPEPRPFAPERWRAPRAKEQDSRVLNPDTGQQITSTLRAGSTSELTAFAVGAADHVCTFPLAAWRVRVEQDARVREISHPADWHALCLDFPHRASDGRLVPNWRAVSGVWDGVHLTLGGMLSCEQARYERDGEWSMMQFWHSEQTWWLNRLAASGERMPDLTRDHNRQNMNSYPYDMCEMFSGPGAFKLMPQQ